MRPSPLLGIFLTVLLDMLSFGMAIPDIQLRGESLGAKGELLGLLLASFSTAQLITAPFLGRLSDRIGRRGVLLISSALSLVCFVVYAHADSLGLMFVSRVFAGIGGANIGVAFAYVADVTTAENRAQGMGMMGAAFGLGFIFGPPLGSVLIKASSGSPLLLGYVAAGLALVNVLYIYFFLPEPPRAAQSHVGEPEGPVRQLMRALSTPGLGFLILMFFVANFGFSNLESTFFRLMVEYKGTDQQGGALFLAWVGVVAAFMQGYLIRVIQPKMGDTNLVRYGYLMQAPMLAALPYLTLWIPLMIGAVFLGFGTGMAGPGLSSLISRAAPKDMQGGIFGVTQSAGALARIMGPLVGNALYDRVNPAAPYLFAGAVTALPLVAAFRLPQHRDGIPGPDVTE